MKNLIQDLRYALRQFRKSPGFALIAVLTLSLAVGAATAVFSVIDAVILRPLPFHDPSRIVTLQTTSPAGYTQPASYPGYLDERAQNHVFSALAGFNDFSGINVESPTGPVSLHVTKATDNFFDVFEVRPMLGRTFVPGEDQAGKNDVVVLSYEVWQTNFGARKDIIGSAVPVDGHPYTLIGVMPAGFRFPLGQRNAIYVPLHNNASWQATKRGSHWLRTIARLKPGVTLEQASADMDRVFADIGRAFPDSDAGRKVRLQPIAKTVTGTVSGPLNTLGFAVLAVLAIGCVNVAGLLLARGVKREREMAMRSAVGASRKRLIGQMLTESLVLAALGMVGGTILSYILLAAMRTFLIDALQRGAEVHLDLRVLAAALILSALTSVFASLAPAFRLSGIDPALALKSGGSAGTGRNQHRLRSAFIVTQVALSLVLLVVAGLLMKSLSSLHNTPFGFDPDHILTEEIYISPGHFENRDAYTSLYQPLLDRVQQLPGVQAAGLINILPIQDWGSNSEIHINGQPPYPKNQELLAENRIVSPGYFDVFGIPLTRGRMLSPSLDSPANKSATVVINPAFVKKFFASGADPIGTRIDDNDKLEEKTLIVGVTGGVRQDIYSPSMAEMDYLATEIPLSQRNDNLIHMDLAIRTAGDPKAIVGALRSVFREVDPTLPFREPETMREIVSDTLVFQRMESWLFGIFAALALLLAVIGLYGLISHEVELGSRDIGVRMALGASRLGVLRMVLCRVALLLATGAAIGLLLTCTANKLIATVITIHLEKDAWVFAALTVALISSGLLAALFPARRAASIEPMQALRQE